MCTLQRLRSAWASAQSDLSLCCAKGPMLLHADSEDSDQTCGCPGWSESSLEHRSFCWFCHAQAQIILTQWSLSITVTSKACGPLFLMKNAAADPTIPPPMMRTSVLRGTGFSNISILPFLKACTSRFSILRGFLWNTLQVIKGKWGYFCALL